MAWACLSSWVCWIALGLPKPKCIGLPAATVLPHELLGIKVSSHIVLVEAEFLLRNASLAEGSGIETSPSGLA